MYQLLDLYLSKNLLNSLYLQLYLHFVTHQFLKQFKVFYHSTRVLLHLFFHQFTLQLLCKHQFQIILPELIKNNTIISFVVLNFYSNLHKILSISSQSTNISNNNFCITVLKFNRIFAIMWGNLRISIASTFNNSIFCCRAKINLQKSISRNCSI